MKIYDVVVIQGEEIKDGWTVIHKGHLCTAGVDDEGDLFLHYTEGGKEITDQVTKEEYYFVSPGYTHR